METLRALEDEVDERREQLFDLVKVNCFFPNRKLLVTILFFLR